MRSTTVIALLMVTAGLTAGGLAASGEEVEQEVSCSWPTAELDVVVIPAGLPTVYQSDGWEGLSSTEDPEGLLAVVDGLEVLPGGPQVPWADAHTQATVDAVETWETAMHAYATSTEGAEHLAEVALDVTVVQPGTQPDEVDRADVLITFAPTMGTFAGVTVDSRSGEPWTCVPAYDPACIQEQPLCAPGMTIVNSRWFLFSFTPTDTYNVMLHEFGHALALEHVDHPDDPMNGTYDQVVGNPTNVHQCPSNLNLEGLAAGFAWLAGEPLGPPEDPVAIPRADHALVCP